MKAERSKVSSLSRELRGQFYAGNRLCFVVSVFASLAAGSLNLLLSWLLQQLIDTASGVQNALPLSILTLLCGGFLLLCIAFYLLDWGQSPAFLPVPCASTGILRSAVSRKRAFHPSAVRIRRRIFPH